MQASFYVLNAHTASDTQAVLDFVCKLIQTVLKKSEHSLVVVDNDDARLVMLDKYLWEFEATSFIPHQLNISNAINTPDIRSPVLLTDTFPAHFDGIILNLSPTAVPLNNQLTPERILEIITPDNDSQQQGRDKYKHYRSLGLTLNHFKL
ncbi:DNA polymerase III subunit chi [Psychrobacter sp. I-STPA10]|uniref:DNA polymerase III subunit chi n=1 Tax=Psychrobacter sp. I-STPA10 TaxID=2585769 RepID=UPI001E5772E3|nr:DNA polymerase III subunit chi [Psychrobacter sp. I-STPA10]